MKRLSAIILAVVMLFAVSACGDTVKYNKETGLVKEGKIIIGIDDQFPPMGFRDTQNNIVGFDIELAKAVAEKMGVEAEFKVIDWASKEQELQNGNIDVIWNGYTITDKRKEKVDFTKPYLANAQVVVVKNDAEYTKLADLAGKTIAAQIDSSAEEAIKENKEFYDSINNNITGYTDNVTALDDLELGRIDALVVDKVVAEYYLKEKVGTFRILDESLAPEEYGVGVIKGNTVLLDRIQKALDELIAEGKAAEISTAWFGSDVVLK